MEKEFDCLKELYKKIPRQLVICFVTAVAAGFFTHLYMLTHKLPNWDDVTCFADAGSTNYLGRWMLEVLKDVLTKYSNPWLNGSVAVFLLAACCCLIVSILELKSTTSAVLVPFVIVTFPSMASTMAFMFTVDMYLFGLLLILLGVYLTRKYKYGFLAGILLCILGLGTYQAYICFAIGLFIFCIFLDALHGRETKVLFLNIIKAVGVLGVSVVLYIIASRLIFPDIVNTEYAGAGSMGKIVLSELPREVARCYKRLLEYFILKPFSFVSKPAHVVNILVCLMLGVLLVWLMAAKQLYRKKLHFAVCLLTVAAAPLGIAFVYVMSPDASFSMLMFFQYVLVYIFLMVLVENLWKEKTDKRELPVKRAASIFSACLLLFTGCFHYVVTGEAYFRMDMAKERVDAYYNRLLVRLEEAGYEQGDAFLILGHSQDGDYLRLPPEHYTMEDEKYEDFSGISPEYGILTAGVRENYMRVYFGMEVPWLEEEEKNAVLESSLFQEMPVYPKDGCVKEINGIWVIKISEGQS